MTAARRALRIAIMIETDGPGGAEMMVFRLAEELRRRGNTVVPVLPAGGVRWLGGLFRGAGFSPEEVHLGRRWIDVPRVRALMKVFRTHSIEVVHSHEFEMSVYGSAAARLLGIPHVMTMHGGLTVTKALKRRVPLRWAMRASARSTIISAATGAQFARDLGLRPDAFLVVPNGVPAVEGDATRVRREFACADGDTVLLAVGNLERNKGHRVLLEALVRLEQGTDSKPWKLIIAAGRGGDQHDSLVEYVRAHQLSGRVHIALGRNDIADLQALADIFVMPSFLEGMPMAMLEAMVAGNAIVASATGGIPEAVTDGREGILVPPGDAAALAAALGPLLSDAVRREALGAAAYARGHAEFTVQVMADRYEGLYATALARATA